MRGIVHFEANVDGYTLTSNAAVVEDAQDIETKLEDLLGQYSGFLSQISLGVYKK